MHYLDIQWRSVLWAIANGVLTLLSVTVARLAAQETAVLRPALQGDFGGLVDIGGGRRIYLECRGTASPTVVLEAGYRSSARVRRPGTPRTMVLAGVAAFTRVCAYDRPGTVAPLKDGIRPSRSDPVSQPRTAPQAVADLHALLRAADVPGPLRPGRPFAGRPLCPALCQHVSR